MTEEFIIHLVREAFYNVMLVVGPLLLASLIVGLTISIFQAATSISEQTLTFVPKLITVFLVTLLLLPFILTTLKTFTIEMITMMETIK
jgi:flagellar biosynthetic protein FliQ